MRPVFAYVLFSKHNHVNKKLFSKHNQIENSLSLNKKIISSDFK